MVQVDSQRIIITRTESKGLQLTFSREQLEGLGAKLLIDISRTGITIAPMPW